MKFGFRMPSIKKRISARTSVKRVMRHNLGLKVPRGFGWLTDPKKAAYNRVYNRTTLGCSTIIIATVALFILLAFAFQAFGQEISKADKKAAKQQAKLEAKAAETERKNMTVDFVQLTKFPGSYLGKQYRLYRVGIGDIKPYTDSGVTYYPMEIASGTESTSTIPLSDAVTFVLTEDLARPVVAEVERVRRKDPYARGGMQIGDVYFELFQKDVGNQRYFIAKVSCVAVIDFFAEQKRTPLGHCPLVK